jgi:hypothetical protein
MLSLDRPPSLKLFYFTSLSVVLVDFFSLSFVQKAAARASNDEGGEVHRAGNAASPCTFICFYRFYSGCGTNLPEIEPYKSC